jgi:hypothetical protein
MARNRVYTMSFSGVTLAAVQDALALYAGTGMAFEVHSVELGQITGVTLTNFRLRLLRWTGTVTTGSGGAGGTIKPVLPSDVTATVTGRTNDTSQASGTLDWAMADVWNTINGYLWLPPETDRPRFKPSQAFVLSLDQAPSTLVSNGSVTFSELF